MADRRPYALVVLAAFALALAVRAAPLHWSPLPATLDGFRYATLAGAALADGALPAARIDADELAFTTVLAAASAVAGGRPLVTAQPMVAATGAATALVGVALARRVARERGWPPGRARRAAALAGLALAVTGLYARRTGVPDEEAFGLLLVPILALSVHRLLAAGRPAWAGVVLPVLVAFPLVHNMSSAVAALALTALVAAHLARAPDRATAGLGIGLVAGFWAYFFGYFEAAERLGLNITYSGLLRDHPGLFLAWAVLLAVGAAWVRGGSRRLQRGVVLAPVGAWLGLVAVNAASPVFPGTVPTPPVVLAGVLALAVPVALAARTAPVLSEGTGVVVLALFAAPVALVSYLLTAALTPQFFGAVIRVQTFAHLPVFVLAGLAVGAGAAVGAARAPAGSVPARILRPSRRALEVALAAAFLASVLATAPLGIVNLDTGSAPSTTLESEFAAVGFAEGHLPGPYATDHSLSRVSVHYFDGRATPSPTRGWLRGGLRPACPVLWQRSWTTTGAHLYPAAPAALSAADRRGLWERHRVYAAAGHDPPRLAVPGGGAAGC